MKNLIFTICTLLLAGCCNKFVNDHYYTGTIKIPADYNNKSGIIAFKVNDENRRALLYKYEQYNNFHVGDTVRFRVAKVKDIVVARNVQETNNLNNLVFDNDNLMELHNASNHIPNTAHTIRHIIGRKWQGTNKISVDGKIYNLGEFIDPQGLLDPVIYAVTTDISLDILWPDNSPADLYFNINGTATFNSTDISDESIEYEVVDAVAKRHSDLPH
ncbi:MAG: hypothetical protein AAGA77_03885 [Bacteroidota bacterium]